VIKCVDINSKLGRKYSNHLELKELPSPSHKFQYHIFLDTGRFLLYRTSQFIALA